MKRIRSTVDEKEQKQLLMDLEVGMKSNDCNYIVQFYGALFKDGVLKKQTKKGDREIERVFIDKFFAILFTFLLIRRVIVGYVWN